MGRKYSVRCDWSEEDDCYIATCVQFPGLTGVDKDEGRAIAELREAIEMAVEHLAEVGEHVPRPQTLESYSGQFRLRVPKQTHAALAQTAEMQGVSINSLAISYISYGLGGAKAASELAERLERLLLVASQAQVVAALQGNISLQVLTRSSEASSLFADKTAVDTTFAGGYH